MLRRLLLWDLDGTLLRVGDLGAELVARAVADTAGRRPTAPVPMAGRTDPEILREHLAALGGADDDRVASAVAHLVARTAAARAEMGRGSAACPGVPALLAEVAAQGDVVSTVLTGNVGPNARVKLEVCGLDGWLDLAVGAYGSDAEDRRLLVPVARARVEAARGERIGAAGTWVIGDAAGDLACARAGGARCLLVATGRAGLDELAALGPDAVVADLTDTAALVDLLTT